MISEASYKQTWITYNATKHNYWACCGDYDCADDKPTTKMFESVSPTDWQQLPSDASTGSSVGSGSELSQSAEIGIGVAVAVVAVGIISFAVVFFLRRRTRAKTATFGRSARAARYEAVKEPRDVQMQVPFVAGENQPYERPSSPMPAQTSYSDRPVSMDMSHQPPPRE